MMQIVVLFVGSSLLGPLKQAEQELNRAHALDLRVRAYNLGAALNDDEWDEVNRDLSQSDIVFVIHVMDGENASRLLRSLEVHSSRHRAVVVINCMPELMRRTRMGRLQFATTDTPHERRARTKMAGSQALRLFGSVASWVGHQARRNSANKSNNHGQYLKLIDRLPGILRFIPTAGKLRDVKNYLFLFCYFLQPTPANVRSMLLYALKEYVPDERLQKLRIGPPESLPSLAIYHPDAPQLFESLAVYQKWYLRQRSKAGKQGLDLNPAQTIGLLLMRPQVVSKTTKHYDALIRAIEAEGLSVIPALSTLMDNREACEKFFLSDSPGRNGIHNGVRSPTKPMVSQVVSLTGFSFVGGPAMNDSAAAAQFLKQLNRPYRSAVSLDMQTVESWTESLTGLNPVQSGMQIAIPEIDGATEPFIYGGIPRRGFEPIALDERCTRLARRVRRWNRLRTADRAELKLAFVLFCFPPSKGNVGTAADLDVFPSVWDVLNRLKSEGYTVDVPASAEDLRELLLAGNSEKFGSPVNVAYRMSVAEYRRLCPHVGDIETEWGNAPGQINSVGGQILIQGLALGNVFIAVQPTFGYEGDPMRLMMARSGAPHHGFMALYTYLQSVLDVDAVIHVGTHGALEFMPGKQVGLSSGCWPDRLIGELPNIYLYSVNNPSEGSIAKRRSYAELISYLTPPIENAGLYKELAILKDLVMAYRQSGVAEERANLFTSIEQYSASLNLPLVCEPLSTSN